MESEVDRILWWGIPGGRLSHRECHLMIGVNIGKGGVPRNQKGPASNPVLWSSYLL